MKSHIWWGDFLPERFDLLPDLRHSARFPFVRPPTDGYPNYQTRL